MTVALYAYTLTRTGFCRNIYFLLIYLRKHIAFVAQRVSKFYFISFFLKSFSDYIHRFKQIYRGKFLIQKRHVFKISSLYLFYISYSYTIHLQFIARSLFSLYMEVCFRSADICICI